SGKCPVSYEAGIVCVSRAGWVLYFQLMLQPEKAACYRWNEIIEFLPALLPKFTFKCVLFPSSNF
ncbi:hypothetical protein N308_01611, partial [Struthio camelus australis]